MQSGEHGTYTRLVAPIGSDRDFETTRIGREVRIVLTPPADFDTSTVFRRLNAGRLDALDAEGDLSLTLGCACRVEASRYLDTYLVLDIYDDPEADAEAAALLEAGSVEVPPPQVDNAIPNRPAAELSGSPTLLLMDLANAGSMLRPNGAAHNDEQGAMTPVESLAFAPPEVEDRHAAASHAEPEAAPAASEAPHPEQAHDQPHPDMDLGGTASSLAEQLSRAASAGLLDAAATAPRALGDPMPHREEDPPPAATPVPEPHPEGQLPIRAANAFDVVLDRNGGIGGAGSALTCSNRIGDVSGWASGLGFEQDIGTLRQGVIDARGQVMPRAAVRLARFYIYYGFGAEAEYWLTQLDDPPEAELSMARYLDDRPGPNFARVETLALCSGTDLLWRFVDADSFPDLSQRQRQEMRLAFARLPLGLRRILGPDFARRLNEAGYHEDATEIREALGRGDTLDADQELLLALETSDDPPPHDSAERLEETMQRAGPDAHRAMLQYLALARRENSAVDDAHIIAAEAMLREDPGVRSTGGLWHEVILAHAARGDSESLFGMLDELEGAPAAARAAIETSVVETLLEADEMAALVVLSTRMATAEGGPRLPRELSSEVHERLLSLGLDALASAYAPAGDGPGPDAPAPMPSRNWAAAAAGTEGADAALAERLSALEAGNAPAADPEDTASLRAAIEDSRAMREMLSDLLGPELGGN
ncbi:hypothetical protein HKCCE2091_13515 [Rhodobacterales bacterium HKCCE2091]|nr:hypothetical protein [Rhodobacterales bacterium HKCCE2091]